jgi:ELWxxDGT repeat protein
MRSQCPLPVLRLPAATALALLSAASLSAQGLVRDIRTTQTASNGSSVPQTSTPFYDAGSLAFFGANSLEGGTEPYVTDGTPGGTRRIVDFVPGSGHSNAVVQFAHAGTALFAVQLEPSVVRYLLTDGTAAGTQNLGDLGLSGSQTYSGERLPNGRVLLTRGASTASQTFATDLTTAGTVAIPGMRAFEFVLTHGALALGFGADTGGTGGSDLWATDGTVAGSARLLGNVIRSHPVLGNRGGLAAWNGRIWFARAMATGPELWSTDGTVAGTTFHTQIAGPSTATLMGPVYPIANGLVFTFGGRMWRSDGTPAGTGEIAGLPCNSFGQMTPFQGRVYGHAVANVGAAGYELWSTDGTAAGTSMVVEIGPGGENGSPTALLATPQGVWFRAVRGISGVNELWLATGPQTAQRIGALPGNGPPANSPMTAFGGGVLLIATEPSTGTEPWYAPPGQAPFRLADIMQTVPGIDTSVAVRGRDRLFFVADDGVHGRELWTSDGTAAGTAVLDLTAGGVGSFQNAQTDRLVPFGDGTAAVTRVVGNPTRWTVVVTDGSPAGTHTLPMVSATGTPWLLAPRGDDLFAYDGQRLFRSDGTPAGTVQLPISLPGVGGSQLFALDQWLVLDNGGVLYATDGVQAPLALSSGLRATVLGVVGGLVVFDDGRGVMATDGTVAGTTLLTSQPSFAEFTDSDGIRLLFHDSSALWLTDGTPAGTRPLVALSGLQVPGRVALTRTGIFALLFDQAFGRELHRYDETLSQFVRVVDLFPGTGTGVEAVYRAGDGDTLLLAATDGTTGLEPWVSDGTAAGMRLLADVRPGPNASTPLLLGVAGELAYLLATDATAGRELHAVPLATLGAASVQSIAGGCFGALGRPELAAATTPLVGAANFGFALDRVRSTTFAALLLGDELGRTQIGGCDVAPAGGTASLLVPTTVAGTAAFALPIPNAPAVLGLSLAAQGFALDGAVPAGFAGSNALFVVIGS